MGKPIPVTLYRKWTKIEVEKPFFTKWRSRERRKQWVIVEGERMLVRRYISPTAAWVERDGPRR